MLPFGFFFDPLYLLFAAPALLLALYAQMRVSSAYNKYSQIRNARNIPGVAAAQYLLRANGLFGLKVESVDGDLTDHYDPSRKTLRLSRAVANTPSVAALGIVAHEIGHATQDVEGFAPMRLRAALVPAANLGSTLGYILFLIGILIGATGLVWLGVRVLLGGRGLCTRDAACRIRREPPRAGDVAAQCARRCR
jgi:Zn-dependent membrane protease YugP